MIVVALAELARRLGFARRLQRPVELGLGAQRLDRLGHRVGAVVAQQRRRLVLGLVVGGVDRDGRDEDVLPHLAAQHLARVADPERQGRRVVDADVPLAALERLQVAGVAVAEQLLDLAGPGLRLPAAVEQGHLVAARERVAHLVRPGESGAAEDQDAQRRAPPRRVARPPTTERGAAPRPVRPSDAALTKSRRLVIVVPSYADVVSMVCRRPRCRLRLRSDG